MDKLVRIDNRSGLVLEGGGMRGVFTCGVLDNFMRSEERRVGKECRSRWSPYH